MQPLRADVSTPPAPPPVPAGYCTTIADELSSDLSAFDLLLQVPPTWKPVPGGPTIFSGNLSMADGNIGPGLAGANYIDSITTQLQQLQALGAKAVQVNVEFPVLYEPFLGSASALAPYKSLYQQVATAVRAAGLKLIVENNVLLSDDIETGWAGVSAFYGTYANNWNGYMAARASMAATLAELMQPDYLILAEEPDAEANQTGQTNMQIPADAADMITQEINSVRAAKPPVTAKLGAGFGNWQPESSFTLLDYVTDYAALPLDYIDFHVYPINTEVTGSFIGNALLIASTAAAAGKPVAISEAFLWKMENSEWNVENGQYFRARQPFSFWQPLDEEFMQTMVALAKYTNMLYMSPEGPQYLFAYQTYGGTTANGGAATCFCTTTSCNESTIVQTENNVSTAANQMAGYTDLGLSYYKDLVTTPDKTPPSEPTNLTGSPAYTQASLSWTPSTDNIAVAGYNVFRDGVQVAVAGTSAYVDTGLSDDTTYNYQVQAFDLANNNSPKSSVFTATTYKLSPDSPASLTATATSSTVITLNWSPPQDTQGLSKYLIFAGASSNNLSQIGTASSGKTSYTDSGLTPSTTYYFGVEAVESGNDSPMSPLAYATTPAN